MARNKEIVALKKFSEDDLQKARECLPIRLTEESKWKLYLPLTEEDLKVLKEVGVKQFQITEKFVVYTKS